MLFNSLSFAVFFPIVILIFAILQGKHRVYFLVFASCYFYSQFIPKYLLILFAVIVIDYFSGIAIERSHTSRKKIFLLISLAANLGILFFFKYFNFFNDNMAALAKGIGWRYQLSNLSFILPIGLSFHVFQSLSYTIEVYRENQKAETDFSVFALYVLYFPQLVAGPIERPQNLLHQFHQFKKMAIPDIHILKQGLFLIFTGLVKKCVVADNLTILSDKIFSSPHSFGSAAHLIGTLFFAFQIYCDFSGYSDIARGCSKFFGIELMLNFNKPYLAKSVSEFWRRWHLSLSTWFRDYVYLPLGGSRGSRLRVVSNIIVVFAISGLWHGANWTFIVWGLFHGLIVGFEHLIKKPSSQLLTFSLVLISWIFFRANNIHDAFYILTAPFTQHPLMGMNFLAPKMIYEGLLLILCLMAFENKFSYIDETVLGAKMTMGHPEFWQSISRLSPTRRWFIYIFAFLTFIILAQFNLQQFIYFQF